MDHRDRAVTDLQYPKEEVAEKNTRIYEAVLRDSWGMQEGNFNVISTADLERLFELYDGLFFSGRIHRMLRERGAGLSFRLSKRMTRAGGKTTLRKEKRRKRAQRGQRKHRELYEIAVSIPLLFQNFVDGKAVKVSGIECRDRLEALQRVFEHELVHLIEMLVWRDSSCSKPRFKQLSRNLFGHMDAKHELVRPHERAQEDYDIRVGDRVSFSYKGKRHVGVVNRVTKRATVLVSSRKGLRYSDGKRYAKYYVPLTVLEKVGDTSEHLER